MKQTGKIERSNGMVIPNKRGLWYSAYEKLDEAKFGIRQMLQANNRVEYESGWIRFLDSLQEAWTSFYDEGKNTFTNFQPWAGSKNKVRNTDSLLSYLIQARHKSQHTHAPLFWEQATIQIAPNYNGNIGNLVIYAGGDFEVDANPAGSTKNRVTLKTMGGNPKLPLIENNGIDYKTPDKHLGQLIPDSSPHQIATMAIDYYENIFRESREKFTGKP